LWSIGEAMVPTIYGLAVLAAVVTVVLLLLPRNGKERWVAALPGMWIVLGLLLTTSGAGGVALLLSGLGILR